MKGPFTIVLVNEKLLVLQALRRLLEQKSEYSVIGEAADSYMAIAAVKALKPNLVILDLLLPTLSGIDLIRKINQYYPETSSLALSSHSDQELIWKALKCGANGFVSMKADSSVLYEAIEAIRNNELFLPPPLKYHELEAYYAHHGGGVFDCYESLSAREREVFFYVVDGRMNLDIANILGVSPRTVEAHRSHLMKKMKFRNQAQLVQFAAINGLLRSSSNNREVER